MCILEHASVDQQTTTYLRSEVEPQVAVVGKTVLDKQRDLVAEAEFDVVA